MKNFFAILCATFMISTSFAQEVDKAKAAQEFVESVGNKIIKVAGEKASEAKKRDKIIAIIDDSIDSDWIARFVLGKNYKTSTLEQQKRFTGLYRQFMINTYGPKFKNYNGRKFTVNEVVERNGFYIAKAEFLPRDSNVAILVDFRVKERNAKLVILDFIVEGVSLVETQRSEFNSAISQNGMDKFMDDLEERVKKLKTGNN